MSAISEYYNRAHNILELTDFLSNFSFTVKRNVIITKKKGKCGLTGEFPNDVRLKKISKLHGIIVSRPIFFPKWK